MYSVSSTFLTKVKESSRTIKSKVEIGESKNICPLTYSTFWELGDYDPTTGAKVSTATRIRLKNLLMVAPSTTYYVNTYETDPTYTIQFVIRAYSSDGTFIRSIGGLTNGATFTTASNEVLLGVAMYDTAGTITNEIFQTDLGNGTIKPFICLNSEPVKTYVAYSTTTLTEVDIVDFLIESSVGADGIPSIGSVSSNKLSLQLIKSGSIPQVLVGVPIRPYVAIDIGSGNYEWIPMSVFYASTGDVTIRNQTISITCFDKLSSYDTINYTSALTYPASVQSVITEIGTTFGINFETQTLPSVNIPFKLEGTVRKVLSQIAFFISRNCTMNRFGQVKFIFTNASGFSLDANNYSTFSLTSATTYRISEITVVKTDGTSYYSGNSTGLNTQYETDIVVDQSSLDTIFNRIYPLDFYTYNVSLQGMPHLDVGDTFTFTDKDSVARTLIIINNKFRYAGGFTSDFSVESPKEVEKTTTVTNGGSTLQQALDRVYHNMDGAISNATNLITGNEGGYVVTVFDVNNQPKELCILDTPDINTATKVWRWNNSGLGYSSTGYTGTYGTAITQDGQIVANYITTGEMSADRILGGTLELGGTLYGNGSAKIYDASNNLLLDMNTNGIIGYGDSSIKATKTVMYDQTYGTKYDTNLTSYGLKFQTTDIGGYGFGASAELNSGMLKLETHYPAGGSHRAWIINRSSVFFDDTSGYTAFFVDKGFDLVIGNDGSQEPTNPIQVMEYSGYAGAWKGFHFNDKVSMHYNLVIEKQASGWSTILFPAQTNDAGFIAHYENNNTSVMRFAVSDDAGTTDYFDFGSNATPYPEGTFTSCAKLYTNGQLILSNGVQITSGEGKGYKFWDSSDNYKISMASGGAGGRYSESTSDYNMYFNMGGGGTNRGFQFANAGTCYASLTPSGGFRVNGSVYSKGESLFTDGSVYSDPMSGTACAIKTTGHIGVGGVVNAYRSSGGDCFNAQNNVSTWAIHRGTSSYDIAFAPAWNWTNDIVFSSGGNVSCVSLTQRSDIKLKVNLQPLDNVLEKLDNINIYKYTLKSDIELASNMLTVGDNTIPSVQKHLGVIAQEVELYFPELVRPSSDIDDTKTIDTYGLLAVALEAIKELRAEVKLLQEKVGV